MILYALLKTLHLLGVIVWVGGMVFAHFFLRPAVASLEPPQRLRLMHAVLQRFFAGVLLAALTVLLTGLGMFAHAVLVELRSGSAFLLPLDWWFMAVVGLLMVLVFGHIRFVLFGRFARAVQAEQWPQAAAQLNAIRRWVLVNLGLSLAIVFVVKSL